MFCGQLAELARACVYDRAGYGFSDASGRAMDATNVTSDLHALLRAAHISTPVVLVGHSIGGLYATLYTDRFPKDVAGLVLVDPSFAGQIGLTPTPDEAATLRAHQAVENAKGTRCADLARRVTVP